MLYHLAAFNDSGFFLLKVWRFKYNDRKNQRRAILHMIPGFCCISYISLENFLIGWHIKYACLITRLEKIYINSFLSNIFQNYGLWGKKGKLFSIFKIMVLKQCFWKGSVFCDFCLWIFWELLQKKIIQRDRLFWDQFFSSKLHIGYISWLNKPFIA